MIRIERLDDRLARLLAAAGAAGDLRQELERPLGRPEVGHPEADVGRDDADQRDAREVVALGDHLRADEHVDLAVAEPRQQRRRARLCAARRRDRGGRRAPPGQSRFDLRLDALGAEAGLLEIRRRAQPGTWPARVPSNCSSGSAPRRGRCPRRARRATRCSSDSRCVPAHCRQKTAVANPRRFRSTSACSPVASRLSMARRQRPAEDDVRARRARIPRACPRP